MTDSHARPADNVSDATIPIVPDTGYASTQQFPFAEETIVDPAGTRLLWSGESGLDLSAPGYGASFETLPQAPQTNYVQPQVAPSRPAPYSPAPYSTAPYSTAPYNAAPYNTAPTQGFAEPSGPIGAQSIYQGYPTAPGAPAAQQPAWPGVVKAPAGYDYRYSTNSASASEHPNAVLSMVLGIVGLLVFQLLSPVAWYLASKGKRDMAAFPGRWRPSGSLTAGFVLGIIGTIFLALGAIVLLVLFIGIFAMAAGS